jgi:hypothetical protein
MDKNLSRGISDTIKLTLPNILRIMILIDKNFSRGYDTINLTLPFFSLMIDYWFF